MASKTNEWEWTADVKSWMDSIIAADSRLPFKKAAAERPGAGAKRRDLTVLDRSGAPALTGEVKLPYQAEGTSPYVESVVSDARSKAKSAKAPFFFTWNVNEFVLWKTFSELTPRTSRQFRSYRILGDSPVVSERDLLSPKTEETVRKWLQSFLYEFADILLGKDALRQRPPDEAFVEILESALHLPVALSYSELQSRYADRPFRLELDNWMRDVQGWVLSEDSRVVAENLENAAKFSCYVLVNKLVFYEALLKRYPHFLERISVPEHVCAGNELRLCLERFFLEAKKHTGDYETVFGEDHLEIGNRIPFYSDAAVSHWRTLIREIHHFDFSKLDYDVVGTIFERLISPEERHKFGQFYTRPEVVDLINSFCIRTGREQVMDPACGGGTFLVRAYVRKRELDPSLGHGELLADLFGVDVSSFAAHLTTINLATRDLIDEDNYPRVGRNDFFNVRRDATFVSLPLKGSEGMAIKGLGAASERRVVVPELDAVVCNPPYVRQEDIPADRKKAYARLAKDEQRIKLAGQSDLHAYFWPHAASFLKPNGMLCFLTSNHWLDASYGFKLQDWILKNFLIVAVLGSSVEPWFVGARVNTVVTILQRESDEMRRMENQVRFIELKRPLARLTSSDGTSARQVSETNRLRDELLSIRENLETDQYRAHVVSQSELFEKGVRTSSALKHEVFGYYGSHWGQYLRAPDLWFEVLKATGDRWVPLGAVAEVDYGLKSGADGFFYVRDVTADYLARFGDRLDFLSEVGVEREEFESGATRLVMAGAGAQELHPIEAEFLRPIVRSPQEVVRYSIRACDSKWLVLQVAQQKAELRGSHVLRYIEVGEARGFDTNETCRGRKTESREWYDLTGRQPASALWFKWRQYRFVAPANPDQLLANSSLYEIHPPSDLHDPDLWGGILNSSWVALSALQHGRPVGNEGAWAMMVSDTQLMLVPNPRLAEERAVERVCGAFRKMREREAIGFLPEKRLKSNRARAGGAHDTGQPTYGDVSELDLSDRRELDEATLGLLGIGSTGEQRVLVDRLYEFLREHFENVRSKEEQAQANRRVTKGRGGLSPAVIAAELFERLLREEPSLLGKWDPDFVTSEVPCDVLDLPREGVAEESANLLDGPCVVFRQGTRGKVTNRVPLRACQIPLVLLVVASGARGLVRVPCAEDECQRAYSAFHAFVTNREARLREIVEQTVGDEETQRRVLRVLEDRAAR